MNYPAALEHFVARATGPVAPPIYFLYFRISHSFILHSSLSALSLLTTFSPFHYLAISFLVTKLPAPNGEGPGEGLSEPWHEVFLNFALHTSHFTLHSVTLSLCDLCASFVPFVVKTPSILDPPFFILHSSFSDKNP